MSSIHRVKVLCRDYFYNPQNIQKILGSTMLFGCAAGYQTMEYIHQNRVKVSNVSQFMIYIYWKIANYVLTLFTFFRSKRDIT